MRHQQFETHCHTSQTSRCGYLSGEGVAQSIKAAGYGGTFITDHYYARFFEKPDMEGLNWQEKISRFLAGFNAAKACGKELGLKVFLGLEVQLVGSPYEFLVYGPDEKFLLDAGPLYTLPTPEFYGRMQENGFLVFQAHPYRYGLQPEDPAYFDGIEIVNTQPRHESRNKLAMQFAFSHDIMIIAGGDVHMSEDIGKSGIMLPEDIGDVQDFLAFYRQVRRPELIITFGV